MSCIKVPVTQSNFMSRTSESSNDLSSIQSKNNDLIKAANRVFGTGWSHAITSCTIDFIDHNGINYSTGCYATVKIQLANGMYHEDCGYSNTEASSKGMSVEKARMTSVTNALSKVLSCFTEMDEELKHFNSPLSISTVPKTKFPLKRPNSPLPPAAQSTPKITKNSIALFDGTQLKKTANNASTPDSGLKELSSNVETVDLDSIFENPMQLNIRSNTGSASSSVTLTEEEMRLERKRKQREKQEEFKKLMRDKEERGKHAFEAQKPNSKF
ncbi:DNA repair protein RAD52 homolog [Leptopilina heterotoma]|uniref:DNA repair protein RAD52 homolog n=1 Tax=Leptopilina heterotoma TaxID=63436 RepID=UPI001CA839A7|nr:DNA repair protein RAD52 homolog [Leptopilina heterotoma]XP_043476852.1 DNA repair protein RAD52 homolog [Leptopilina heterotoma]